MSTPTLTCSLRSEVAPNASSPMSSETVNPMPPRSATPRTSSQDSDSSSSARVKRATTAADAVIPIRLADDQPGNHAQGDGIGERVSKARNAPYGHAGGEEREDRHCEAGGKWPHAVLEVFSQARPGIGAARCLAAHHRYGQGQQHSRDGGVHAGLMDQHPGDQSERDQQPPRAHPPLHEHSEHRNRNDGQGQPADGEVVGEEHRDDRDGQQVIDDRECEQEGPQCLGQVAADHGQHGQSEGDVRGRGDRPARAVAVPGGRVDPQVEQGRDRHPSEGGRDRQRRAARIAQIARDELALELQPGDEEEDRQQPVGCPGTQRQVEMQRRRAHTGLAHCLVGVAPWRVCPHQRHECSRHEQRAADRFLTQDLCESCALAGAEQTEQPCGPPGPSRCGVAGIAKAVGSPDVATPPGAPDAHRGDPGPRTAKRDRVRRLGDERRCFGERCPLRGEALLCRLVPSFKEGQHGDSRSGGSSAGGGGDDHGDLQAPSDRRRGRCAWRRLCGGSRRRWHAGGCRCRGALGCSSNSPPGFSRSGSRSCCWRCTTH